MSTTGAPEDPTEWGVPGGQDEKISNVWVLVGAVFLFGLKFATEALVEALLEEPSWLEKTALMVAIDVPVLVVALKLFARHRVRAGHY